MTQIQHSYNAAKLLKNPDNGLNLVSMGKKTRGILFDYNGVLVSNTYQLYIWSGLSELLSALSKEYRLGIVSGAPRSEIVSVLEPEGLLPFFDTLITANEIEHSKPHPDGYLQGIKALGLPASNVIAVEDSPGGIAAAKAAGLLCIAVQHTVPEEKLSEADNIITTLADIKERLAEP